MKFNIYYEVVLVVAFCMLGFVITRIADLSHSSVMTDESVYQLKQRVITLESARENDICVKAGGKVIPEYITNFRIWTKACAKSGVNYFWSSLREEWFSNAVPLK